MPLASYLITHCCPSPTRWRGEKGKIFAGCTRALLAQERLFRRSLFSFLSLRRAFSYSSSGISRTAASQPFLRTLPLPQRLEFPDKRAHLIKVAPSRRPLLTNNFFSFATSQSKRIPASRRRRQLHHHRIPCPAALVQ